MSFVKENRASKMWWPLVLCVWYHCKLNISGFTAVEQKTRDTRKSHFGCWELFHYFLTFYRWNDSLIKPPNQAFSGCVLAPVTTLLTVSSFFTAMYKSSTSMGSTVTGRSMKNSKMSFMQQKRFFFQDKTQAEFLWKCISMLLKENNLYTKYFQVFKWCKTIASFFSWGLPHMIYPRSVRNLNSDNNACL